MLLFIEEDDVINHIDCDIFLLLLLLFAVAPKTDEDDDVCTHCC